MHTPSTATALVHLAYPLLHWHLPTVLFIWCCRICDQRHTLVPNALSRRHFVPDHHTTTIHDTRSQRRPHARFVLRAHPLGDQRARGLKTGAVSTPGWSAYSMHFVLVVCICPETNAAGTIYWAIHESCFPRVTSFRRLLSGFWFLFRSRCR